MLKYSISIPLDSLKAYQWTWDPLSSSGSHLQLCCCHTFHSSFVLRSIHNYLTILNKSFHYLYLWLCYPILPYLSTRYQHGVWPNCRSWTRHLPIFSDSMVMISTYGSSRFWCTCVATTWRTSWIRARSQQMKYSFKNGTKMTERFK